jgi:hypothetical protein
VIKCNVSSLPRFMEGRKMKSFCAHHLELQDLTTDALEIMKYAERINLQSPLTSYLYQHPYYF